MTAATPVNLQSEPAASDGPFPATNRTDNPTKKYAPRLTSIDAIRGIAALSVVVGHSLEEFLRQLPQGFEFKHVLSNLLIEYLNLGRVGVVAFFCVSGYVIPFSFSDKKPLRSFMIARFFRLYPAYWLSLLGAVAVTWILQGSPPPLRLVGANLTMVQSLFHQPDLLGVYWTLFYELTFYVLCMISFKYKKLQSPSFLLTVIGLLSAIGMASAIMRHTGMAVRLPIGLFMFLAIMHLGTLARLADRDQNPAARKAFLVALIVILTTSGPISGIGFIQHASDERLMADVTSIYAGLILFFYLRHSVKFISTTMLFLGKISYSLYLFHPLCLLLASAMGNHFNQPRGAILALVAIPTTSLILAALAQHFVEAPANRLGRTLKQKILILRQ